MIILDNLLYNTEKKLRGAFEVPAVFNGDRVLLASYPKSGNTWLRFIVSNISRLQGSHGREVDFHSIEEYAPVIRGNRHLTGAVETPGCPLFLKTHFPYVPGFGRYKSVLVVRNPEDVMLSYYIYLTQERGNSLPGIGRFVRHWRYGIPAWRNYHLSWMGNYDVLVRYEDLLADAFGTVDRMYKELGYRVSPTVVKEAIECSSKDNMRRVLNEKGDPRSGNPGFQFVRSGVKGEGKRALDRDDIEYISRECGPVLERLGYAPD
jgi:hypothetical protein